MEPEVDSVFPKLRPILTISNKEFKEQFGKLAGSWRGKRTIQRNAIMALANLGGREALPDIITCLDDQRPVIRGTAVWAIAELTRRNPSDSIERFNQLKAIETDPEVLQEIEDAFELFKNPRKN